MNSSRSFTTAGEANPAGVVGLALVLEGVVTRMDEGMVIGALNAV